MPNDDRSSANPYAEKIIAEYNRWATEYRRAFKAGDLIEMSVAAFMCNKINLGIVQGTNDDLREYFYEHAQGDDHFDDEVAGQVAADDDS